MPEINYPAALENMKIVIKNWENRNLTPIGKIRLIKTNAIYKIIHLLTVLPKPKSFLEAVNSLLYTFLSDNKTDKVNQETVCMDNLKGGFRMINIYDFEKALKVNWLKQRDIQTDAQCNILF